ncbi:hypothetical protein [Clostridium rectalis]|uniref:hypothetical protein n=1 Tax=Clostridium rectalis TaxID=2040295 RepID=UPI000F636ED2|nr:hypothetical protein [Clostridium rectalis]
MLHSLKVNQWIDLTSGYTLNRKGNELYQAFIPKLELGNYEAIVFCKEANSMGNKTVRLGQYDVKYDDYIVKKFEYLKNGDPIVQVNLIGGRGSSFGQ